MRRQIPRNVQFSVSPTWGESRLRHATSGSGTGAGVTLDSGQLLLSTGTDGTGNYELKTRRRGQYRAGTFAEAGLGVELPAMPTGSQDAKWGYFDDSNGVGFGVDSDGIYIFRRSGGTQQTKVYQDNWNLDTLDTHGRSGLDLREQAGNVYNIRFEWYGHGEIVWRVDTLDEEENRRPPVPVHREVIDGELSLEDPNQPIKVIAENNGTASNLDVRVSEMQFSLLGDGGIVDRRQTTALRRGYTLSSPDTWEPVIAVQKQSTLNGQPNSPLVWAIRQMMIASDTSEMRVTADADTSAPYGGLEQVDASETAIQADTSIALADINSAGRMITHSVVSAGAQGNSSNTLEKNTRIPVIEESETVMWVRSTTTATFDVVSFSFEEEW